MWEFTKYPSLADLSEIWKCAFSSPPWFAFSCCLDRLEYTLSHTSSAGEQQNYCIAIMWTRANVSGQGHSQSTSGECKERSLIWERLPIFTGNPWMTPHATFKWSLSWFFQSIFNLAQCISLEKNELLYGVISLALFYSVFPWPLMTMTSVPLLLWKSSLPLPQ